jgi:hypothetical protein
VHRSVRECLGVLGKRKVSRNKKVHPKQARAAPAGCTFTLFTFEPGRSRTTTENTIFAGEKRQMQSPLA